MLRKILIVADDLTGASDCGVAFAGCGTEPTVLLGGPDSPLPDSHRKPGAGVLAFDADTRCLAPKPASEEVARIVHSLYTPDDGHCLLFKKVDSTLRGNVGAELAAALHAMRSRLPSSTRLPLLFGPAFPAQARTTANGIQLVNGRRLEQAGGHGATVPPSDLGAMLQEAGLSCGLIELATIRGGVGVLALSMRRIADQADAVICDAETDDDLLSIAKAGMALGPNTMWAGSAGLARQLALEVGLLGVVGSAAPSVDKIHASGPALFVVGSPASVSREQARALAAAPGVARFPYAAKTMRSGHNQFPDPEALAESILERLANREDVLVQLESEGRNVLNHDRELAQSLGRALRPCAPKAGALVATGGETARAILEAWGIRMVRLVGEVEPGVPYSVAECGNRSLPVVTKAGGFGTPGTLLRCREFLRESARNAEQKKEPAAIEGRKS